MAEVSTQSAPQGNRLTGRLDNPVTIKELRSRMRGRRAFIVLTLYLIALSGVIILVYLAYTATANTPGGTAAYTAGKGLFAAVLAVQVVLVVFIGPAFTAGAISGERERQTFDLLRTTLLSAESFVLGKLISALSYIFLLILVSIPLQSIAFLIGGLSLIELVLSEALVLLAAITYALYGLWCSAAMRSTLAATVAAFGGMLLLIFGIPMLALAFFTMLGISSGIGIAPNPLIEIILIYGGLFLAALNLPATLIVSEAFLLQQGTLIGFSQTMPGGAIWIISPWILFAILHALACVVLYKATVRRVRRVSDV